MKAELPRMSINVSEVDKNVIDDRLYSPITNKYEYIYIYILTAFLH